MAKADFSILGLADIENRCPPIKDTYSGLLIVVASAACVWDDLEKAGQVKNDDNTKDIMCVNDMIMHYPGKVEHAYSNNHQYLPKWVAARRDQWVNRWGEIKHTHSCTVGGKHTWPWPGHGTSTLNAVYTGLALGYNEIWLCGAPLDNTPHYFEPPWLGTNFANMTDHQGRGPRYWSSVYPILKDRVKSFSGNTRKLLGSPHD